MSVSTRRHGIILYNKNYCLSVGLPIKSLVDLSIYHAEMSLGLFEDDK